MAQTLTEYAAKYPDTDVAKLHRGEEVDWIRKAALEIHRDAIAARAISMLLPVEKIEKVIIKRALSWLKPVEK